MSPFIYLILAFIAFTIIKPLISSQGKTPCNRRDDTNQQMFMNQTMYHDPNDMNYNGVPDNLEQDQRDLDHDGIPDYMEIDAGSRNTNTYYSGNDANNSSGNDSCNDSNNFNTGSVDTGGFDSGSVDSGSFDSGSFDSGSNI